MAEVFRYEVIPSSSWAYLSTILMVSIFFKFNRLISIRNVDIILLALLSPGLLMVQHGEQQRRTHEAEIRKLGRDLHQQNGRAITQTPGDPANTAGPGRASAEPPASQEVVINGEIPLEESKEDQTKPPGSATNGEAPDPVPQSLAAVPDRLQDRIVGIRKNIDTIVANQSWGYAWLFLIGACLMTRMLADPYMIRRPLLEPNLEFSGLTFLTVVLLVFLIANVISATVTQEDIIAAESGKDLATAKASDPAQAHANGPGYSLLFLFPVIPTFVADEETETPVSETGIQSSTSLIVVTRLMAILGQLAIVVGIYMVGFLHFNNTRMGIGIVTLYLLLPYTAEMTGRIIHILPAAAMVWAVVCYRRPVWSGAFIGLAMGLAYYPLFLVPLWFSFYWHRGLRRFLLGFFLMVGVLVSTLIFTSADISHFLQNVRAMFGLWAPIMEGLHGFWEGDRPDSSYRIPVIAAFFCISLSFAAWPAQKNLGTLVSCSAALMLAVQFWNGFGGGILMAWYLPLTLMTMFRPNLEDRTAVSLSLDEG